MSAERPTPETDAAEKEIRERISPTEGGRFPAMCKHARKMEIKLEDALTERDAYFRALFDLKENLAVIIPALETASALKADDFRDTCPDNGLSSNEWVALWLARSIQESAQLTQARADDDRNNQVMVELMRQRDEAREDLVAAAGELRIPIPESGTDMARLMIANSMIRHQRDDYHRKAIEIADQRDRAISQRDELMAALLPFAQIGDIVNDADCTVWKRAVTAGSVRAARAAIAAVKGGK